MKPTPADPSHGRAQELQDDARKWRTATLGNRSVSRQLLRPPERSGPSGPTGAANSRFLLGIFVPIAALFVLAILGQALRSPTPAAPIPGSAQTTVWSESTTCVVTDDGALRGSAVLVVSEDPVVREAVQSDGLRLWWNGSADGPFSEERTVPATGSLELTVTDTILPAGSLNGTPDLLRCGVRVTLP